MKKLFETDLLFGVVSGKGDKHFLLADIDGCTLKQIVRRVCRVCIKKHRMGHCYIARTGKGWHITNFSDKLTLRKYMDILKDLKADPKYIYWVGRVKYGVLRVSRRSSHWNVPYIAAVVNSPYRRKENQICKITYLSLLDMEKSFNNVCRVYVEHEVKDYLGKLTVREKSKLKKQISGRKTKKRSDF